MLAYPLEVSLSSEGWGGLRPSQQLRTKDKTMETATLSKKAQKEQERESARAYLLSILGKQNKPTLYTNLKSVSSSGMSRDMKVLAVVDGEIVDVTYYVGKLDIGTIKERNGQRVIRVGGCGMDMGFHVVYTVSAILYGYEDRGAYTIRHEWI
jgi:hypothetical protein